MNVRITFVPALLLLACTSPAVAGSPWNTSFSISLGLNTGGMQPYTAPENPLVFKSRKDELKSGFGFAGSLCIEKIHWNPSREGGARPDIGFRIGIGTNSIQQEYANSILDHYKLTYTRIPLELMYCISSKDAYIRDDDEISISGDRVTFHKGTGVIKTHSSVFLHGGVSFNTLNSITLSTTTSTEKYQDSFILLKPNIHKKDPSLLAGIEFRTANVGLDVTYQKSINSIYSNADVRSTCWMFSLKFIW